jgi:hypothetical protein
MLKSKPTPTRGHQNSSQVYLTNIRMVSKANIKPKTIGAIFYVVLGVALMILDSYLI